MDRLKVNKMAKNLINHSVSLGQGENLLIESFDVEGELIDELIKEAQIVGGNVFLWQKKNKYVRKLLINASEEQIRIQAKYEASFIDKMNAYIGVRGSENSAEFSDVPADKMEMYNKIYNNEVHMKVRIPKTKWCVMAYPTGAFAQKSHMSSEALDNFYLNVCSLDYGRLGDEMEALKIYMDKVERVRITGKGTDISFATKGLGAVKCFGKRNMPDGEVYIAPVLNSVEGVISYNVPCDYMGFVYEDVCFEIKEGKIVKATGNDNKKINELLDSDEGARYIGEFAIGVNPYITKPIAYTLFDEKMWGSIHLTPGNPYAASNNGNKSVIHWDLVLVQTPEYGGGEIYFDGVLIRKDGVFVVEELKGLNPENLKKVL